MATKKVEKKVGATDSVTLVKRESFYENGELKIREIYSDKTESIRGL